MTGVPKTKRCQGCKRRKIKCDEDWPTCGGCARARAACSGPPNSHKFVTQSNYATSHSPLDQTMQGGPDATMIANHHGSLVLLQSQPFRGTNASISRFRLYSSTVSLSANLTTSADRVAARLAAMLTHHGPRDLIFQAGYLKYLPARIDSSPALRDTVTLICSAYANFQRGLSADQVLNPSIYGKALRSLGRALDDHTGITTETVAATTIMERAEILFDGGRPFHRARHAIGVDTLTRQRGPPKLDDMFDVQLALENHAALVARWTVDGGDNFFLRSPWKEFMDRATSIETGVSQRRKDMYVLGRYFVYLPSLLQGFQRLNSQHSMSTTRIAQAKSLERRVSSINVEVQAKGWDLLEKARSLGDIKEREDQDTPIGARYEFACLESLQLLVNYAWWSTICNRMLDHLRKIQGLPLLPTLGADHRRFCHQLWMCIPYIRELGGTTSILFVTPLYVSYEGTTSEAERKYVFEFITEIATRRGRVMRNPLELENLVLNTARAMSGRDDFFNQSGSSTHGESRC